MALVGAVPLRVNNRPAVSVTDFNVDFDRPGQIKVGGYGTIGTATGGAVTGTGSFKMAPRQENGLEFPLAELLQPFTLNFPLGTQRFAILGCTLTRGSVSVAQKEGNTDAPIQFIFEEIKQTR
jgi:hypothetical protein